jgi:hypothetical protein
MNNREVAKETFDWLVGIGWLSRKWWLGAKSSESVVDWCVRA